MVSLQGKGGPPGPAGPPGLPGLQVSDSYILLLIQYVTLPVSMWTKQVIFLSCVGVVVRFILSN